jgi:hypothetical protein
LAMGMEVAPTSGCTRRRRAAKLCRLQKWWCSDAGNGGGEGLTEDRHGWWLRSISARLGAAARTRHRRTAARRGKMAPAPAFNSANKREVSRRRAQDGATERSSGTAGVRRRHGDHGSFDRGARWGKKWVLLSFFFFFGKLVSIGNHLQADHRRRGFQQM